MQPFRSLTLGLRVQSDVFKHNRSIDTSGERVAALQ